MKKGLLVKNNTKRKVNQIEKVADGPSAQVGFEDGEKRQGDEEMKAMDEEQND